MRAIDADYLIKRLDKCDQLNGIGLEPVMAMRDIKMLISLMPEVHREVKVTPVVHGRWIYSGSDLYQCSACKFMFHGVCDDDNADNYCRHCGAKMDLEEQHDDHSGQP